MAECPHFKVVKRGIVSDEGICRVAECDQSVCGFDLVDSCVTNQYDYLRCHRYHRARADAAGAEVARLKEALRQANEDAERLADRLYELLQGEDDAVLAAHAARKKGG